MSFISATYDHTRNKVIVWERDPKTGLRSHKYYKPSYYFFVPTNGTPDAIALNERPVSKVTFNTKADMEAGKVHYEERYESDFSIIDRILMDNYYGLEAPPLVTAFFDIEVDYNPEVGFAGPNNPYAPICAIAIYNTKEKDFTQLALAPPEWDGTGDIGEALLCESEAELLKAFLVLIRDVDILSGWNSEYFDLPYIAARIERVLGKEATMGLNFESSPNPIEWAEVERFGNKDKVVNLTGRGHLDYLRLFKKFTYEGRQSYALGAIAEDVLGIGKLHFTGSLHSLYHENFPTYLKYNLHDADILVQLDAKLRFIELANKMVHEATVNFKSVFGSVQLIDTAIVNFAHHILKRVVFDKAAIPGQTVEGALVLTPKIGLNRWVFSCDINSLYPSVYRALNLSPEKLLGQFVAYEAAWHELRVRSNKLLTLRLESGELLEKTTSEWEEFFKKNSCAVSAYGTVLDQGSGEGLVPAVLSHWFEGRKELQAKKKQWEKEAEKHTKNTTEYEHAKEQAAYYDLAQLNRKILLNSTYGATLNEYCRFHDPRLGASTTGTGRQITTFMIENIGNALSPTSGELKKVMKTLVPNKEGGVDAIYTYPGDEIIYSDTDSVYASVAHLTDKKYEAVHLADAVVGNLNDSFAAFMREAFYCTAGFDDKIKANREVVAESSIFQAKKKYMLYVVDMEGKSIDKDSPKALKTMGSDIKLSSTPLPVKNFLKAVTMKILWGEDRLEIEDYIIKFRDTLTDSEYVNVLEYASRTSVKVLEDYTAAYNRLEKTGIGKTNMPGNVRATINYNEMLKLFNDRESLPITSGSKIKVLYLLPNEHKLTSIAFPSEMEDLPGWFTDHFKVNIKLTEQKLIDKKLGNIYHAIGWQVPTRQTQFVNKMFNFE